MGGVVFRILWNEPIGMATGMIMWFGYGLRYYGVQIGRRNVGVVLTVKSGENDGLTNLAEDWDDDDGDLEGDDE